MLPGNLPPTDHILGALTIARLLSYTRAAQELGLSQPALSRQIQHLERHLGVRLFDRVGRSVRLTPAGEEFTTHIGPLVEELSRVTVNLATSGGSNSGRVRLGASESVTVHMLPGVLRSYLQSNRRVDMRLTCATTERLPEMVSAGEIDIAVTSIEYEPPGLRIHKLWEEELVLVLPMGHKARSRSILSYKHEDFVLLSSSTITRRLLDGVLKDLGVELKVALEHNSPEVIKAMVTAGLGLAILPEPTVRRETRRGELAAWPLSDMQVTRPIVAMTDPRRQPWPAEIALLDALTRFGGRD
ncbi:MAG: LysR family transcriptional regulator [Planctomycetota bacterium]